MPQGSHEPVRSWMRGYFAKNEASFKSLTALEVNWDNRNVMPGAICLGLVTDLAVCTAAGSESLGDAILGRAGILLSQAQDRFGNAIDRDEISLDRIELALAARLGAVFSPGCFTEVHSIPLDAFPRYLRSALTLEEKNVCRVLWALLALLDGDQGEYEAAGAARMRAHNELRDEMKLVLALPDLAVDAESDGWSLFETVLARWLNPVLRTTSYASNFQEVLAASMSLFWCKYHLRKLDRPALIGTYLGETLSVPVMVG